MNSLLAIADGGDPTSSIAGAANTIDLLLLAIIGALIGMVVLIWIATKVAGSVLHMLAGVKWLGIQGEMGKDLHSRANSALIKLLIEAPLIIFGAVLVGHLVSSVTGFSIPITFPNLSSLGAGH